jgi:hypothetical protein
VIRTFKFVLFAKYYYGDEIKQNRLDLHVGRTGEMRNAYRALVKRNQKENDW